MSPLRVWSFSADPGVVALIVAIAGGYVYALRRVAPRWAPRPEAPVSPAQVVFFSLGVTSIWLALGWPLDRLADEYLFSAHMVQHMVLGYVTAPLLLLGTPGWMLRAMLGRGALFRVVRFVCKPALAFVSFNVLLVVTHWPAFVDLYLRNEQVHAAFHLVLLGVSLVVWMPIVSPLPEIPRLGPPTNLLYLFGQSMLPTVPASFLTFGDSVVYKFYAHVPRLWHVSALTDQQVGGLIMKVGGGFLLWGMIAVLFFVWQADEERRNRRPAAPIDFDELELELSGLDRAR